MLAEATQHLPPTKDGTPSLSQVTSLRVKLQRPWNIRPGHYVQICLPRLGSGFQRLQSIVQSHPFMILWWDANDTGTYIHLAVERREGFTAQLLDVINRQEQAGPLLIDGPYGQTKNLGIFETVVLFADDIGISAILPYAKHLLHESLSKGIRTKEIILIWRYNSEGRFRGTSSRYCAYWALEYGELLLDIVNDLLKLDTSVLDPRRQKILTVIRNARYLPDEPKGVDVSEKKTGSAWNYSGDYTIESLLRKHIPKNAASKVLAGK
jgi:NAD(P)H-flavin reductase